MKIPVNVNFYCSSLSLSLRKDNEPHFRRIYLDNVFFHSILDEVQENQASFKKKEHKRAYYICTMGKISTSFFKKISSWLHHNILENVIIYFNITRNSTFIRLNVVLKILRAWKRTYNA